MIIFDGRAVIRLVCLGVGGRVLAARGAGQVEGEGDGGQVWPVRAVWDAGVRWGGEGSRSRCSRCLGGGGRVVEPKSGPGGRFWALGQAWGRIWVLGGSLRVLARLEVWLGVS